MVEGVGVSGEQLDEWERLASMMSVSAVYEIAVTGSGAIQALVGEVRASHAREAELLRDNLVINKATFMRTHPDSHIGHAPSIAYSELEAERDVLQQRIDKALELSEYERDNLLALLKAVSGWGGPSVLSAANTGDWVMQVAGKLNPSGPEEGDWGRPNVSAEGIVRAVNERVAAARAALTATGDSE